MGFLRVLTMAAMGPWIAHKTKIIIGTAPEPLREVGKEGERGITFILFDVVERPVRDACGPFEIAEAVPLPFPPGTHIDNQCRFENIRWRTSTIGHSVSLCMIEKTSVYGILYKGELYSSVITT